jgi:hypothetical protein
MPGCQEESGINHHPCVGLPLAGARPGRRNNEERRPSSWVDTGQAGGLWKRCHGDGQAPANFLPIAVANEDNNEKLCQHYSHFFMLPGTRNLTPSDTQDGDSNCVLIDGEKRGHV